MKSNLLTHRLVLLGMIVFFTASPAFSQEKAGPKQGNAELDQLFEKAQRGSDEAVRKIGETTTTEATAMLLALTDTEDKLRLHAVLPVLVSRMPIPKYADRECPFTFLRTKERERLSATAWDTKFNQETRALAKRLLSHEDNRVAGHGASMITCVGDLKDTPAVIQAMDRLLDKTKDPRAKPGYMPAWFTPFLMASQGQTFRGAPDIENPQTSGEIVAFVNKLATHKTWRPKGWQDKCAQWRDHPVPYIRHIAGLALEMK